MTTGINTGLPQLPEDHFWRVNATSVEIRRRLPDTDWEIERHWGYYDHMAQGGTRETRQVTKTAVKKVAKWFRVVEEEYSYQATEVRVVGRTEQVTQAYTDVNGETTLDPGRTSALGTFSIPPRIIENRHPVTRRNIQFLCEKALEKFDALSLIGDYPPKKLEG